MKDKQARALAIVALVFMVIFIAALIATLVDYTLLGGSIGYIALGTGVFVMMIFIALKADGRGYSITKMNNEIEMEKIQKEQEARNAEKQTDAEDKADDARSENSDGGYLSETEKQIDDGTSE